MIISLTLEAFNTSPNASGISAEERDPCLLIQAEFGHVKEST